MFIHCRSASCSGKPSVIFIVAFQLPNIERISRYCLTTQPSRPTARFSAMQFVLFLSCLVKAQNPVLFAMVIGLSGLSMGLSVSCAVHFNHTAYSHHWAHVFRQRRIQYYSSGLREYQNSLGSDLWSFSPLNECFCASCTEASRWTPSYVNSLYSTPIVLNTMAVFSPVSHEEAYFILR